MTYFTVFFADWKGDCILGTGYSCNTYPSTVPGTVAVSSGSPLGDPPGEKRSVQELELQIEQPRSHNESLQPVD